MNFEDKYPPDWDDNDEPIGLDACPACGKGYDEVDFEYQICHRCGHNANPKKYQKAIGHPPAPPDPNQLKLF